MRPSSLRALLLALAMVLQAIAGGPSVARAASASSQVSASAHCERLRAPGDAAPAKSDDRRHMCQSCLLCAGPPIVTLGNPGDVIGRVPVSVRGGFVLSASEGSFARIAHGQRARAPPPAA